jgi:hypothetical protein
MMQVDPHPAYALLQPAQASLHRHCPSSLPLFTRGETPPEHPLCKILPNTRNTISFREDDASAPVKLFTYALLALLFPPNGPTPNNSLLETLKCCLYSRDLNFTLPRNSRAVDSLQAKAMLTRFLHALAAPNMANADRLREGEAMLEANPLLVELFVLFFRAILGKLDLEGAQDCGYHLPFEETVVNLLEFFDVHHRHVPALFLLPEENYFLAAAGQLHFGEYF